MKLRKFLRGEEGATAVVVALCMTVLMGCTAFAVDYGMMVMHRQSLQNAVDAAVLAGAQDLDKGAAAVRATVKEYCRLNGFDPDTDDTVQMEIKVTETQLAVTLHEDVRMGFSSVVTGKNIQTVGASAKAGVEASIRSLFVDCPYAMFAGDSAQYTPGITGYGTNITIDGSIHSNGKIDMASARVINGTATAIGSISLSGGKQTKCSTVLEMPDLNKIEDVLNERSFVFEAGKQYYETDEYGNQKKDSKGKPIPIKDEYGNAITGIPDRLSNMIKVARGARSIADLRANGLYIYIKGSVNFGGNDGSDRKASGSTDETDFPIVLIADGDISFSGCVVTTTEDAPLMIISKNGGVNFWGGGGSVIYGIVFAPNGNVNLNGISNSMGRIIAKNIIFGGGDGTIFYREDYDELFPVESTTGGKVLLLE